MPDLNIQQEPMDAIILCGGLSKRMGQDKAWLAIDGEYFLNRLVSHLQPLVRRLVVVKAAGQDIPQLSKHVELVDDDVPEEGPLSGFVTGVRHLRKSERVAAPVWLASCDSPFFSEAVFFHLFRKLSGHDAVAVDDGEHLHPFSAWYCEASQRCAGQAFADEQRSLTGVLRACNCVRVRAEDLVDFDPELRFLRSVNTLEDLTWATTEWESGRS